MIKMKTWHFNQIEEMIKEMTSDSKKVIYQIFKNDEIKRNFGKVDLLPGLKDERLRKGPNDKYSKNVFQFTKDEFYQNYKKYAKQAKEAKDAIRIPICKIFGIDKNDVVFENKFDWACDGQSDELEKISLLTSSTLCALLCFYNVSKETPLIINMENGRKAKFTESIFEWQNPVFGKPSSIDVVLIGTFVDKPDQKVVYFVESKFSEYFNVEADHPSKKYLGDKEVSKSIYTEECFKRLGLKLQLDLPKKYKGTVYPNTFTIGLGDEQYAQGVSQMITHYVGVNNFLSGKKKHNLGKYLPLPNDAKVYLGTIIYQIKSEAYDKYIKLAKKTAKILSKDLEKKRDHNLIDKRFVKVLYPRIYQNIFKGDNLKVLTKKTRIYYGFK